MQSRGEMKDSTKKYSTPAPYWKVLWWPLWSTEKASGSGLCENFRANSYPQCSEFSKFCVMLWKGLKLSQSCWLWLMKVVFKTQTHPCNSPGGWRSSSVLGSSWIKNPFVWKYEVWYHIWCLAKVFASPGFNPQAIEAAQCFALPEAFRFTLMILDVI